MITPGDESTQSAQSSASAGKSHAIAIGVCILVGVGLVMSMQSVSLMTGSGPVWTGVAVVAAGAAVAFFMRAAKWVRVVAAVVLVIALVNAFYIEHELSNKRDELTRVFDGL